MTSIKDRVVASLDAKRNFLTYIKANALLHDADKITEEFIRWSLQGGKTPVKAYQGHALFYDDRKRFLDSKRKLLPYYDELAISFPCQHIALEPQSLRRELCNDLLKDHINDVLFIDKLKESGMTDAAKALTRKSGQLAKKFFTKDYTAILQHNDFVEFHEAFNDRRAAWLYQSVLGKSLFDFYLWHHSPNLELKCNDKVPTALQLFSAGTAGVDGIDTGYETESEKIKIGAWHHEPQTLNREKLLIATPFGFEIESDLGAAEKKCRVDSEIMSLADALVQGRDVSDPIEALERKVETDFSRSIIRTGRPLNDVTLADHSISTAAMAAAHGARVVLESASAAAQDHYYCLPIRAKYRPENSNWPVVQFAIFSCAVNADHLDAMAMDLKDITAIRREVDRLLTHFIELFTCTYPLGGFVYQDQHGVHLVVPVLGDPEKRWVRDSDGNSLLNSAVNPAIPYLVNVPEGSLTNESFREWLFETAQTALLNFSLWFDQELLIGLRYAKIGDQLNRLAKAIKWTRTLSHLGVSLAREDFGDAKVITFQYRHPGWQENTLYLADLCTVCGLRLAEKAGRCRLCGERVAVSTPSSRELSDIEKMAGQAEDNRLALLSVAFNLDSWLSEEDNSGIFCYAKDNKNAKGAKKFEKDKNQQRFNSFGRLRRIWRVSERFLLECRDEIRRSCRINADNDLSFMRTILLQPQDLQVIMPADRCGAVLDIMIKKFQQEFGRVAGRVPFHVSVVVFPFRTPIYLVLEGARRLRKAALTTAFFPVQVARGKDEKIISLTEADKGHRYCFPMPVHWLQKYQPVDSLMEGQDQFHANFCTKLDSDGRPDEWIFAGTIPTDREINAYMVNNRLSLAEISGGLILSEFEQSSSTLPPSRCHDIPLEYWHSVLRISVLEKGISKSKQRTLRADLARWEILWDHSDPLVAEIERAACEALWRDPQKLGGKRWNALPPEDQELLVDSCLNGGIFVESMVKKRLKI